jgi:hypothetical protein
MALFAPRGLLRRKKAEKKGVGSQEIARTRRSQETILGENPESRRSTLGAKGRKGQMILIVVTMSGVESARCAWSAQKAEESFG